MQNYAKAENCPADVVREYVEKIKKKKKEYVLSGREVPEELLIPSKIELSPKSIQFLLNSKLVDKIDIGNNWDTIEFYWEESEQFPPLTVKTKRENDGKYYLTYMREEASKTKEAFEWDIEKQSGKSGVLTVFKQEDALEDIVDMDNPENMQR